MNEIDRARLRYKLERDSVDNARLKRWKIDYPTKNHEEIRYKRWFESVNTLHERPMFDFEIERNLFVRNKVCGMSLHPDIPDTHPPELHIRDSALATA